MAPGVYHCAGGPGPNDADFQTALERWVEAKVAPDSIVSKHATSQVVDRTRPLCAYPKVAVWKGAADTNDAASFTCREPGAAAPR